MPRDVSSSSSEDEEEEQRPGSADPLQPAPRASSRFQVPADFVPLSLAPVAGTDNELWLIKAPLNFDPQRLRGVPVSLSGLQTLKVPGGGAYSVLASNQSAADLRLVAADRLSPGGLALAPPFSGLLNVCDRHGDDPDLAPLRVIAAPTPPSIPPGLRQRFIPFGCSNAAGTLNAPPSPPSTQHLEEEEEGGRKRRKKKKKEKKIKTESEVDGVKEEEEQEEEEVVKKKRRKEEVKVKEEPTDCCYGNEEEKKKKKKKKKKTENEED